MARVYCCHCEERSDDEISWLNIESMSKNTHLPQIIYEDDVLVVINKPPHILTVPDRWDPAKPNLDQWLKEKIPTASIVHRLDRETSGVILFAKTSEVHRALSLQFQRREIQKTYWALVNGTPIKESDTIDLPIADDPKVVGKMYINRSGKSSFSHYQLIEKFRHFSLVYVYPKTGRHHQVRVHLEAIGHSLVVDPLYGGREQLFLSEFKRNYRPGKREEQPLLARVSLHALQIEITHPLKNEKITFEAELPKDLQVALKQIRKWD